MKKQGSNVHHEMQPRCCPCGGHPSIAGTRIGLTRRSFLKGIGATALGTMTVGGLSWPLTAGPASESLTPSPRVSLRVKPVLVYSTPQRRPQTSWRSWGGTSTFVKGAWVAIRKW